MRDEPARAPWAAAILLVSMPLVSGSAHAQGPVDITVCSTLLFRESRLDCNISKVGLHEGLANCANLSVLKVPGDPKDRTSGFFIPETYPARPLAGAQLEIWQAKAGTGANDQLLATLTVPHAAHATLACTAFSYNQSGANDFPDVYPKFRWRVRPVPSAPELTFFAGLDQAGSNYITVPELSWRGASRLQKNGCGGQTLVESFSGANIKWPGNFTGQEKGCLIARKYSRFPFTSFPIVSNLPPSTATIDLLQVPGQEAPGPAKLDTWTRRLGNTAAAILDSAYPFLAKFPVWFPGVTPVQSAVILGQYRGTDANGNLTAANPVTHVPKALNSVAERAEPVLSGAIEHPAAGVTRTSIIQGLALLYLRLMIGETPGNLGSLWPESCGKRTGDFQVPSGTSQPHRPHVATWASCAFPRAFATFLAAASWWDGNQTAADPVIDLLVERRGQFLNFGARDKSQTAAEDQVIPGVQGDIQDGKAYEQLYSFGKNVSATERRMAGVEFQIARALWDLHDANNGGDTGACNGRGDAVAMPVEELVAAMAGIGQPLSVPSRINDEMAGYFRISSEEVRCRIFLYPGAPGCVQNCNSLNSVWDQEFPYLSVLTRCPDVFCHEAKGYREGTEALCQSYAKTVVEAVLGTGSGHGVNDYINRRLRDFPSTADYYKALLAQKNIAVNGDIYTNSTAAKLWLTLFSGRCIYPSLTEFPKKFLAKGGLPNACEFYSQFAEEIRFSVPRAIARCPVPGRMKYPDHAGLLCGDPPSELAFEWGECGDGPEYVAQLCHEAISNGFSNITPDLSDAYLAEEECSDDPDLQSAPGTPKRCAQITCE